MSYKNKGRESEWRKRKRAMNLGRKELKEGGREDQTTRVKHSSPSLSSLSLGYTLDIVDLNPSFHSYK